MHSIWQDLRFAVRVLIKGRWFTLAAIVALALGIGANNAMFTLVNAILLRGLPFDRPERITWMGTREVRTGRELGVSLADFDDWQRTSRTFSGMALTFSGSFNINDGVGVTEQFPGSYMSAAGFTIIGQTAAIGRIFGPEDDRLGAPAVVVLGSALWKQRYGGETTVIGRSIRINGLPATVIGVMGEGMQFPNNSDAWMPLAQLSPAFRAAGRQARPYQVFGRLADGLTIDQARAELTNITAELARQYPATNKDMTGTIVPYNDRVVGRQIRLIFWALMGAVAFVLLIACSNVANLLLARAAHRAREVSVRVSLGATRWRIVRQLLVESLLLSLVAGALGLALSVVGIKWFDTTITPDVGKPYWMVFTMDARTFAFLAAVCAGTGILFGLAPALHISKTNVNEVLKEGGRSGSAGVRARRWTSALIVTELTLTLVLLAGAGFMMRSFLVLYRMDLGVDTSHMLMAQMILPARKYPSLDDRTTFLRRVDDRLATVNNIAAAATASTAPLDGGYSRQLAIDGRPPGDRPATVTLLNVGARYFSAIGVRLTRGRMFADTDGGAGHEAAVVNERFAAMHFPGDDPIGKRIRLIEENPGAPQTGWFTIVGVSPTIRQRNFAEPEPDPVVYVPHLGNPTATRGAVILVRTNADPGKTTAVLREEIRALDPDLALSNIRTMDQHLAQQRWSFRVFGTMFAAFAVIAIVLAAVGLYAVTAYSVTQRTQEIGVRMALGAEPRQVWWLVLRRGLLQLAIGLALGLAGAVGVGLLLQSVLVQTSPADPLTLAVIVALLSGVAIAACLWPARQATRLDPVVALRYE